MQISEWILYFFAVFQVPQLSYHYPPFTRYIAFLLKNKEYLQVTFSLIFLNIQSTASGAHKPHLSNKHLIAILQGHVVWIAKVDLLPFLFSQCASAQCLFFFSFFLKHSLLLSSLSTTAHYWRGKTIFLLRMDIFIVPLGELGGGKLVSV